MFLIKLLLNITATIGLSQRLDHRLSKSIGIQNHFTIRISRSTTNNLNKWSRWPQKSLFVCIQYSYQSHLRQIDPLSKQIYSHNNINLSSSKFIDNFPTINSRNLTMKIKSLEPLSHKKIGYFFRGFFGQSYQENFPIFIDMLSNFSKQMLQKSWSFLPPQNINIRLQIGRK